MPIIKSAIKRVRQQKKRTKRNSVVIDRYKARTKEFNLLIEEKKKDEAIVLFPKVQKSLDMAAKKNLLHTNNVARKVSSLAKKIASLA